MKLNDIFTSLFPKICTYCLSEGEDLCKICLNKMQKYNEDANHLICYNYCDITGKLVKSLKYQGKVINAKIIASIMCNLYSNAFLQEEAILIPVPSNFFKIIIRGYSHTALICAYIAKKLHIKYSPFILKRRLFKFYSQVGLKKKQRLANLDGAFYVTGKNDLAGKNIILLDDVITTGTTVKACTQELLKHKPKSITVVAFAYKKIG